ncbi:MAG: 2-C-methyl-D-erythritol 2,4-cyclodiphosphate synthase [Limnohabitans sp.]
MNVVFRVGQGWDVHALVPGRPLVIGGVNIPHTLGLLGHSDADVLLHAIIDALLGAMALGDIGKHFPDTDEQWKNADSKRLLLKIREELHSRQWQISNIDATVIAQAPKLAVHIPEMSKQIAIVLGIEISQVNIKAKTAERLGPVGQGMSMEAQAVVLIQPAT